MNILAIETTGHVAAAALLRPDRIVAEFAVNNELTHSRVLMSLIDHALQTADFDKGDIDYIACSAGPGSFTGLRIGAAAAKGLAFGLCRKIVPVSTLDALAYNVSSGIVVPIMDARRGQVYTALYRREGEQICRLTEHLACDIEHIIDLARKTGEKAVFLGDGAVVHVDRIVSEDKFSLAPLGHLLQRASAVGALALQTAGEEAVEPHNFAPFYIRPSQAERNNLETLHEL